MIAQYTPAQGKAGLEAKFNRGLDQLKRLEVEIRDFIESPAGAIDFQYDAQDLEVVGTISITKEVPLILATIIGEIVYDFRSTLDHLIYALTFKELKRPLDGTEFPIFKDDALYSQLNRKGDPDRRSGLYKIRGITNPTARAIIRDFQPFTNLERGRNPENHFLWMLHEVNNADKHRRLQLCCCTFTNIFVYPSQDLVGTNTGLKFFEPRKLEGTTEVIRWTGPPEAPNRT